MADEGTGTKQDNGTADKKGGASRQGSRKRAAAKKNQGPAEVPGAGASHGNVSSAGTGATDAPKIGKAPPVTVTDDTRRSLNDVITGHFCTVVGKGDEAGTYGVLDRVVEYDDKTGYPKRVLVRDRRSNDLVQANYEDLRPAEAGGR